MTIYVDEPHEQKQEFQFNPISGCLPEKTCVNITKNIDSITISGKLTNVPTNYTATLEDGNKIMCIFGKDPTVESTIKPAPINQESTAESIPNSSAKTTTGTKTVPLEQINAYKNNANENEQKNIPTSSSERQIVSSTVVVQFGVFAQ